MKHIVLNITESTILKSPRTSKNSAFENAMADNKRSKEKARRRKARMAKLARRGRAKEVRVLIQVFFQSFS